MPPIGIITLLSVSTVCVRVVSRAIDTDIDAVSTLNCAVTVPLRSIGYVVAGFLYTQLYPLVPVIGAISHTPGEALYRVSAMRYPARGWTKIFSTVGATTI